MTQVYDVIVIGCGAAGVAALCRLEEHNFRVLGLEGTGHLGGRIHTQPFGNNVVDLGAQWCHGERDNAVYSLVKNLDVVSPPSGDKEIFLARSNGDMYIESESKIYLDLCASIVKEGKESNIKSSKSLYSFLKEEYKKQIKSIPNVNIEMANDILEWYLKTIQAKMSANELLEKSLNSVRESWDNQGEQWLNFRDKGYKTILDILLKRYPDSKEELPANILYNKEVLNIKWNCSNLYSRSGQIVQVTCRDGSLYIAKHAIVTVSLGVLKERYETMFTPSIPDDKVISIRSLAMCTMNKIYMKFSTRWWPKTSMSFGIIWSVEDKSEFCDEYDDWLIGVYELTTVEMQPDLLCAWVTGIAARDMETCSTDLITNGIYRMLKHFFAKDYQISKPQEIIRSTWYSNSLTRGSFSYRSIETECVDKGASTLSEPLMMVDGIPKVCFAGEATSLHHHSTVHGAVESGFREADRLIQIL